MLGRHLALFNDKLKLMEDAESGEFRCSTRRRRPRAEAAGCRKPPRTEAGDVIEFLTIKTTDHKGGIMAVDAAPKAEVFSLDAAPKAQVFSLKTPLLSSGRTQSRVAKTDLLDLHIKVYAQGGENGLHTHKDEDHSFVILQGQAIFYDDKGTETVVKRYEGILLPRGAFYRFQATGDENLVMIRIGAVREWDQSKAPRVGPNGQPLTREENKSVRGTVIPGQFFGV